jgi:hypothetical protein
MMRTSLIQGTIDVVQGKFGAIQGTIGGIALVDADENKPVWPTWAVGVLSDADENKPVWPTWAVGVLSGVRDVETYNLRRPS